MKTNQATSKWLREYRAGKRSGRLHDYRDRLCGENLVKMRTGIEQGMPLVRAYWLGYEVGLREQGTIVFAEGVQS